MPVIDKETTTTTRTQSEQRFSREPIAAEVAAPAKRAPTLMLIGGLVAAAIVIVGIVFAASGGDSKGTAAKTSAAPAATQKAATSAPVPSAKIAVTLEEFTITPSPAVGRAGTVTFRVHNGGAMRHEFVVLRTNKPADALLKGNEASEAGNVGEIPGLAPGATKTLRLPLKAGHYALICNMPGHYMAGQRVDFVVR
jgi:uncharacterized cupredoxin-like copper-binding protein